jgi:hypothetical protein
LVPSGSPRQSVAAALGLYVALRDEAVRRGVTVEYGKHLTDAERTAAGVRATFTDGGHTEGGQNCSGWSGATGPRRCD